LSPEAKRSWKREDGRTREALKENKEEEGKGGVRESEESKESYSRDEP